MRLYYAFMLVKVYLLEFGNVVSCPFRVMLVHLPSDFCYSPILLLSKLQSLAAVRLDRVLTYHCSFFFHCKV